MKTFPKILITGAMLVAILVATVSFGAGTALPLNKKLPPGTTTVYYSGQELRFTTSVALYLKLTPLSEASFEMSVYAYGAGPTGVTPEQVAGAIVEIDWPTLGEQVYNGPPPPQTDPFEGIFNSESGFTEK